MLLCLIPNPNPRRVRATSNPNSACCGAGTHHGRKDEPLVLCGDVVLSHPRRDLVRVGWKEDGGGLSLAHFVVDDGADSPRKDSRLSDGVAKKSFAEVERGETVL